MAPSSPQTLRAKSFKVDFAVTAVITLILGLATWFVFNNLQDRFIAVTRTDASKVHVFIDAQLTNAQEQLVVFSSLPEAERQALTKVLYETFSDIYQLAPDGEIQVVYKRTPDSQAFEGFSFSSGQVWDQLLGHAPASAVSSIIRGYEDGLPSIYIAYRQPQHTILGRLNLDYLSNFIEQYTQITGNVLLLTTNQGVVMVSGKPSLGLPRIDITFWERNTNRNERLLAANQAWVPVVSRSEMLDARLVVLISTELLSNQRTATIWALASIFVGLVLLVLWRNRQLRKDILVPVASLLERIRALESGDGSVDDRKVEPSLREFQELDTRFKSMAQAIRERESDLAQANEALAKREEQQRRILQQLPIPLVVFERTVPNQVTFINDTFVEVFGYTHSEIRSLEDLFSHSCQNDATARQVKQQVERLVSEHSNVQPPIEPIEVTIACRSGVMHDVMIAAIALESAAIATFVDVTPLRNTQRELLKAKLQAEDHERQKSQFLATMSHEIRTPLTTIMGVTQLLEHAKLDQSQREWIDQLAQANRALLRIINDVLDQAKIEAGELEIVESPFSLRHLVQQIEQQFGWQAAKKGLYLSVQVADECPDTFNGDSLRIEQVLTNFISNALKFTAKGSIEIQVQRVASHNPNSGTSDQVSLEFKVIDTGIGISQADSDNLFQPFKQISRNDSGTRAGTGLGLFISKKIVELMGGRVGYKSELGKGSTFWFELPLQVIKDASFENDRNAISAVNPSSMTNIHVLVVDDSSAIQFLIRETLESDGMLVTQAFNGQEALQLLKSDPLGFDVVLMDIQMPVMNGIQCMRAIRMDDRLSRLAIIAMTAGVLEEQRQAAVDGGADLVMGKPLDLSQLLHNIRQQAELAREQAFPRIAHIDILHATQTMNHNPKLFLRLVHIFLEDQRDIVSNVQRDLENGENLSAANRLHSLRGGAAQIGALALVSKVQEIENDIRNNHMTFDDALEEVNTIINDMWVDLNALDRSHPD